MSIEKVTFRGLEQIQFSSEKAHVKKEREKELSKEDKEKSNAAKYMIGATALGIIITAGIIGHKNNWWRKALAKSSENTEPKTISKIFSRKDGTKTSMIEVDPVTGKTITKTRYKSDGFPDTMVYYDPETGKRLKVTKYGYNSKPFFTTYLDPQTGKRTKTIYYSSDAKTADSVISYDYDPQTGKRIKDTFYRSDGKTLSSITDYSPQTRKKLKTTEYFNDGKSVRSIVDYDPQTQVVRKRTTYRSDGTLSTVSEYKSKSGWTTKEYYNDGKTVKSETFKSLDCLKVTNYSQDGQIVNSTTQALDPKKEKYR